MSKRFIAYFIGVILATVAFVGNAQAQDEEYYPIPPCDVVLADSVIWDQPLFYMEVLPCGCRVFCEYYYAYTNNAHMFHISQYWVSLSQPNCTHNLSDLAFWGDRDLTDIGLHNYLEIKILEKFARAGTDINNTSIVATKAKCKTKWMFESPIDIKLPGPIEFDPADIELIDIDVNFPVFPADIWWKPCSGEKCCVSSIFARFEDGFSTETGNIYIASKSPINVFEKDTVCTGGIFFPCKYDCGDMDYYFDKGGVRRKEINVDQIASGFSISPNPSDGTITLTVSDQYKEVEIVIADMLGNIVLSTTQSLDSQDYNLSQLSSGLYTVTIKADNSIVGKEIFSIVK